MAPSTPEGHGVERPVMMAQLHRAQAEALDDAAIGAALDVFADPEGVVEQIEDAADHVAHQGLRAEADGDADDAGARDEGPDLDPERGEAHHGGDHDDEHEQHVAQDRQKGAQARLAAIVIGGCLRRGLAGLDRLLEARIDHRLDDVPHEIGGEDDEGGG